MFINDEMKNSIEYNKQFNNVNMSLDYVNINVISIVKYVHNANNVICS